MSYKIHDDFSRNIHVENKTKSNAFNIHIRYIVTKFVKNEFHHTASVEFSGEFAKVTPIVIGLTKEELFCVRDAINEFEQAVKEASFWNKEQEAE